MDELAVELGRDPMELRRQNWIKHEEFPFTTVVGLTYDTGNYEQCTDQAMATFDYAGLRREQEERRRNGDPVQLGIGISTFTEMCGLAPSRVLGSLAYGAGGWEAASIRMLATGKVEVITGASAHGQGHETAFSQIVADQLGVPFEDVEILHGDTQISPKGLDTYGSRSLVVGGIAIVNAAQKVVDEGQEARGAPARGVGGRHRVRERHVHRPRHRQGQGDPGDRVRRVHGARLPGGHGTQPRLRRRRSTRRTSPSRTARTSPPSRSTPRPGTSTCASTSAWTTSATWSTR